LFHKSSGLTPLLSNRGIGAYAWGFLGALISSQGWHSGLCGEGYCPFCWTAWVESAAGFLFPPCFHCFDGLSVTSGSSEVVSPDGWLVSSIWFLLSMGRFQLGPVIGQYQFVQGGQICCGFCQVSAELLYNCNSGWSVPPPVRWGNSVL
jgi:hypothetical protein